MASLDINNDMKWIAIMFVGISLAAALGMSGVRFSESRESQAAMENGYVQKVVEMNGKQEKIWVKGQ